MTWYGRYTYTDPATGKRAHKRISAGTRKECEAKLRAAIHEIETGSGVRDKNLTLRTYLVDWLKAVEQTVRPATHKRYSGIARVQILPALGNVPLVQLNAQHLQELYTNLLASGLSPATVHYVHAVMHRALHQAVRKGLVLRNVCDLVDSPRPNTPEMQT